MTETLTFESFDGVQLDGEYLAARGEVTGLAVLVHGVSGTRDENGLHSHIAEVLSELGYATFRADWRCHGRDAARPLEELTLAGVHNDIDASIAAARRRIGFDVPLVLVAASFTGGVLARWARDHPAYIRCVILLNPVVDYLDEYIETQGLGSTTSLTTDAIEPLNATGRLTSQRKPFGRAILNEMRVASAEPHPAVPHWIIQGDLDEAVNIQALKRYAGAHSNVELLVLPGAGHGFIEPATGYGSHQSRANQKIVGSEIANIVCGRRLDHLRRWKTYPDQ